MKKNNTNDLRTAVLSSLLKIPINKVTTYGELAKYHKTSPRAVASILRANKEPDKYPCYKIIMSDGKIGGYCGSDSKNIKKKIALLKTDGIVVKNGRTDMKNFLYKLN